MNISNSAHHTSLYRIWRPLTFGDVVGQEHITQTLTNAVQTKRVAHAYLFSGPRGTGKTTMARILAKAVNCLDPSGVEPCNQCANCTSIINGSMVDVLEIDAASHRGVDEIRQLRDRVRYISTEAEQKVYIIDEAHMLTTEAFNALLKVIEEPPAGIIFILATTEIHKIPATILSRCQSFSFVPITDEAIIGRLQQIAKKMAIETTVEALTAIARAAEGGLRDAIGIFEQAILVGGESINIDTVMLVLGSIPKDVALQLLMAICQAKLIDLSNLLHLHIGERGVDPAMILTELTFTCRDRLISRLTVPADSEDQESLKLTKMLQRLVEYQPKLRQTVYPRIMLEAALLSLAMEIDGRGRIEPIETSSAAAERVSLPVEQEQSRCQCAALTERIVTLEKKIEELAPRMAPPPDHPSFQPLSNRQKLPLRQLLRGRDGDDVTRGQGILVTDFSGRQKGEDHRSCLACCWFGRRGNEGAYFDRL